MINLNNISSIIFDLGGVILNVDYNRIITAFKELNIFGFESIYSKANQGKMIDDFEKGKIKPGDFRNEVRQRLKVDLSDQQIDNAWNSMLLDLPHKRLDLLTRLKENYKLILLTNTNVIHYNAWHVIIKQQLDIDNLDAYFHKSYYSHLIGMRKPDKEIFELLMMENNLDPASTLFIDDSIQHIEGAKTIGIRVYHFKDYDEITELFD